jgi:hypothetical protein
MTTTTTRAPFECGARNDPSPRRQATRAEGERKVRAGLIKAGATDNHFTTILAADLVGEYVVTGNVSALAVITTLAGSNIADRLTAAREAARKLQEKKR